MQLGQLLVDSHAARDWLSRTPALASLNQAIGAVRAPACIALYGSWGIGKTSMLRQAMRTWEGTGERPRNRAVWFNTWEHDQRGDVVSPLLWTIAKQAAEWNPGSYREIAGLAVVLAGAALMLGGLHTGALHAVHAAELKELGEAAKAVSSLWGTASKLFEDPNRYANQIEEAKKKFAELVWKALEHTERDSRLVVFLDDLDRCLPGSVVSLLEATKLLLCGTYGPETAPVVFVFGLDRTIVGEAIAQRYPGSSQYTGESYLEKIFDVSVEVPPVADTELRTFVAMQRVPESEEKRKLFDDEHTTPEQREAVLALAEENLDADFGFVGGYRALARTLLLPAFSNPRVVKRVLNRLALLAAGEEVAKKAAEARSPAEVEAAVRRARAAAEAGAQRQAQRERLGAGPTQQTVKAAMSAAEADARRGFLSTEGLLAVPDAQRELAQNRFLLWVAAAERFRSFRYAFIEASEPEIVAFHLSYFPDPKEPTFASPVRLGDTLRRVLGTPGFLSFYGDLTGWDREPTTVLALRRSHRLPNDPLPPVGMIDLHLRRYGV